MSQGTDFGKQDGVDLKDLFDAQIKNVLTLIEANDKNYNQRFDNVIEATKNALAAADRAVTKAEGATEKRFEGVNEFRNTLSDQQRTFVPRNEIEILIRGLNDKIDALNSTTIAKQGEKVGIGQGWAWAVAIVSLVIAAYAIIESVLK